MSERPTADDVAQDEGYRCTANRLGNHCVRYERGWFCPECGARLRLGVWWPPARIDGSIA